MSKVAAGCFDDGDEERRRLFEALYEQLRTMARQRLRESEPNAGMDATSLLNGPEGPRDPQFLRLVARAMRSVIVEMVPDDENILRFDEALDELAKAEPRMAQVVEMRYFGGMEHREIATALGVAERTVRRDWQMARARLSMALK